MALIYLAYRDTGVVGLGNAIDIGLTIGGLFPEIGIPIGVGYLSADYLWYQYSGYTINRSLNSVFYKKIW